ncbi:hypothetical protein FOG18_12050 [Legionella israelensis]|uniref:hypothetical protein n=1 Tax=Legionella israelensis TaxID=454 RepID=UPI00117EE5B7|nr:hypothetical protein [Legionella israelensis]QDP73243.1 hypothetical protein FOG18_12050 [Legionella israelensis]
MMDEAEKEVLLKKMREAESNFLLNIIGNSEMKEPINGQNVVIHPKPLESDKIELLSSTITFSKVTPDNMDEVLEAHDENGNKVSLSALLQSPEEKEMFCKKVNKAFLEIAQQRLGGENLEKIDDGERIGYKKVEPAEKLSPEKEVNSIVDRAKQFKLADHLAFKEKIHEEEKQENSMRSGPVGS